MATLTNKTTTEYAFKTPIAIHSCTCTTYNFHGAAPAQTVRFGKMLVVLEDFAKMPMVKPSQTFYKVAPVTNESTGQLEGKFVAVPNCSMYFLLDKRKGFFVFRTAKTPEIAYRMCSDALQSFDDQHNTSYIRQITDSTPAIPSGMYIKNQDPQFNNVENAYEYNWDKYIMQNLGKQR